MALFWLLTCFLIVSNILLAYFYKKLKDNNLSLKHRFDLKAYELLSFQENQNFSAKQIESDLKVIKILLEKLSYLENDNSVSLLENAVNSSLNGIFITDAKQPNNPIIYVNKGFEVITGYRKEEVLGQNFDFLENNEAEQHGTKKLKKAILTGVKCRAVVKNYRKNGDLFWNEIYLNPVENDQGNITHFIAVQNDITKKYNLEQALRAKTRELSSFSRKLKAINKLNYRNSDNLEDSFFYYLENACNILDMQIGIIIEVSQSQPRILSQYCSFNDQLLFDSQYHLINVLSGEVVKARETLYNESTTSFNLLSETTLFDDISVTSYLATPIWVDGHIYGTIHLFSTTQEEHYLIYQRHLIGAIAHNISKVITAEESELEKEYINIALRESQERLNGILSSLEDVIWSIHPHTLQLIYINSAAETLYECSLSSFFQKRCYWLNLVHPEHQQEVKEIYSNILNISLLNDMFSNHDIEYKILLPNGREKFVRDRAYVIYDDEGNITRIDGIITDITKKSQIQKALEKSEEELRLIFDLAPIGMMITDKTGKIEQVNYSLCQLLNYSPSDLIDKHESLLYHPDDTLKYQLFIENILSNNQEQYQQERRYLASNGTIIHIITNISILKNNEGEIIQLIQQIIDISQLKSMEEQILHDSLYDKLTGLANRFLLLDRLEQTLKRCTRNREEICAILLIDIDEFKKINDSMGHNIGDKLLAIIADKIVSCVTEKDTVARISGDEFVVLLDDIKSSKNAENIAQKIISACNCNNLLNNTTIASSVSIGITLSSIDYEEKGNIALNAWDYKKAEEMIRDADLTMYQAKQSGRNCYRVFQPIMHKELVKKLQLESYLRKALQKEELELYYQPIIDLKTGMVAGFEALVRWFNPELGFVSPVKFIPIAEENGLIIPLGDWIFQTAATQAKIWEEKYPQIPLSIAINVSSKQLLEEDFLSKIDDILMVTKTNPLTIKVEITESVLMDNFQRAKNLLEKVQSRNIRISLDDFGTGYSSLSYLHSLPFNTLKIDRAFIQPLRKNYHRNAIVEAIVSLAHNLSLDVVAEGIEISIQEEVLKRIGCDYGQGYFYSKPMNASDADAFIQSSQEANIKST